MYFLITDKANPFSGTKKLTFVFSLFLMMDIVNYLVDEYKGRIKKYLDENYPEKSESFISQVKPKTYLPIGGGLDGHINGVNYGKASGGGRATKKTNQGNYELGK